MQMRVLLATALALVGAAAAAPAVEASGSPRLVLVDTAPLVVRGTGFAPAERVVVTALTLTGPRRTVVRATRGGRLSATIRVPNQPCGRAFLVRAVGGRGSIAALAVPGPPCVPPPIR